MNGDDNCTAADSTLILRYAITFVGTSGEVSLSQIQLNNALGQDLATNLQREIVAGSYERQVFERSYLPIVIK